jgi:hypothetical protein
LVDRDTAGSGRRLRLTAPDNRRVHDFADIANMSPTMRQHSVGKVSETDDASSFGTLQAWNDPS